MIRIIKILPVMQKGSPLLKMKQVACWFVVFFLLFSCKKTVNIDDYKKNITGGLNELLVVLPKDLHESSLADSIYSVFKRPAERLYAYEPSFTIIKALPFSLGSFLKTHRSILQVEIGEKARDKVYTKNEKWAYTQAYAKVEAKSEEMAITLFADRREELFTYFKVGEHRRLGKLYKKNPDKKIFSLVKKSFNINFYVPAEYNINKPSSVSKDFIWLSKEEAKTSQGFLIYAFDYKNKANFSKNFLSKLKNTLWKKNIKGHAEGSYMSISKHFPVEHKTASLDARYSVRINGFWETVGDFMGGPFTSVAFLNHSQTKVIVIDAYVYGPSENKRNLLTEIEAVIQAIEFPENPK